MAYRTQTFLGALQFLAIIAGMLVLEALLKGIDAVVLASGMPAMRFIQGLAHWGGLLLIGPLLWIKLTLQAERSERPWATTRFTFLSGLVLLAVLAALFGIAILLAIIGPNTLDSMGISD